jgi:hypothetical protein
MNTTKAIKNRQRVKGDICARTLGGEHELRRAVSLWESHKDLIHLISASNVLDFSTNELYTKDEFLRFKQGATSLGVFLTACVKEAKALDAMNDIKNSMAREQEET